MRAAHILAPCRPGTKFCALSSNIFSIIIATIFVYMKNV